MNLVHVQSYSLDPSVFVLCTQAASEQPTGHSGLTSKVLRFPVKTRGNDMRRQKLNFKCDLRKYCFTTMYIIFIESEEIARRLGVRSIICSASASAPIQAIQSIQPIPRLM